METPVAVQAVLRAVMDDQKNTLTPDPVNSQFSVAVGEARSQGIEVDVKGQVSDAISLIGTYACMRSLPPERCIRGYAD